MSQETAPTRWKDRASKAESAEHTKRHLAEGVMLRGQNYHEWRRRVGHGCSVMDVDQVEWRETRHAGIYLPVAIIELTTPSYNDGKPRPDWHANPKYLSSILDRYERPGAPPQGYALRYTAARYGTDFPGFIVLHDHEEPPMLLWVYRYAPSKGTDPRGDWRQMTLWDYEQWLRADCPWPTELGMVMRR